MIDFAVRRHNIACILVFVILALVMLPVVNSDYLFAVQNNSLFLDTGLFFSEHVAVPGGLSQWVGCFLTQFFAYPWVGSIILIALWIAIYYLLSDIIRKSSCHCSVALPLLTVGSLLLSVIQVGYWMYYLKIPGYCFTETIEILSAVLMMWGGIHIMRHSSVLFIICIAVVGTIGYAICGFWALIAILSTSLLRPVKLSHVIAAVLCIGVIPFAAYHYYTSFRIEDAWTICFPVFSYFTYTSWTKSVPFLLIALILVIIPLLRFIRFSYGKTVSYSSLFVVCLLVPLLSCNDSNFKSELRMYRFAISHQWNGVINEMSHISGEPTRQMVMLSEQALIHKGRFGNEFRAYENGGVRPDTDDSLNVRMIHTIAPLLYMNYGQTNFATRWCIENGVEFGFTVNDYKILAICAFAQEEYKVAAKYLEILRHTTLHRSWAEHYLTLLHHPDRIGDFPVVRTVREMVSVQTNMLSGDNDQVEAYLVSVMNSVNPGDSPLMRELVLAFSVKAMDPNLFWPCFVLYADLHQGEPMPIHYQEAAYAFATMQRNDRINLMPFDQERVVQRYASFISAVESLKSSQFTLDQAGRTLKSQFGDTYWWYLYFCRQDNLY